MIFLLPLAFPHVRLDCRIKEAKRDSIRMGKDEKIAQEAGIKFHVKVLIKSQLKLTQSPPPPCFSQT